MKIKYMPFLLLLALATACQPRSFSSLSPDKYQALQQKKGGVLVDVRTPDEFHTGHLQNAVNSDWRGGQFAQEIKSWDKDKTYYLYCASGNRSGQAMELMKKEGFKNVYNLGGYKDLKAAGLKVEQE